MRNCSSILRPAPVTEKTGGSIQAREGVVPAAVAKRKAAALEWLARAGRDHPLVEQQVLARGQLDLPGARGRYRGPSGTGESRTRPARRTAPSRSARSSRRRARRRRRARAARACARTERSPRALARPSAACARSAAFAPAASRAIEQLPGRGNSATRRGSAGRWRRTSAAACRAEARPRRRRAG